MAPYRVKRAANHQGSLSNFGHLAGMQCTSIAFIFAILSAIKPIEHWQGNDLDIALRMGSELYHQIIYDRYDGQPIYLMHNDLPSTYVMQNRTFHMDYILDQFHGVVSANQSRGTQNAETLSMSLQSAINSARVVSSAMILTMGQTTITIISHRNGTIHICDSHARNTSGQPSPFGTSILMSFRGPEDAVTYLNSVYRGHQYILSPILIHPVPQMLANNVSSPQRTCTMPMNSSSGESSTDPEKPTYNLPRDHQVPQMLANNVSSPQRARTMPMNSSSGEPSSDPEKPTYSLPSDHQVPQMLANNVSSRQRTRTMPMNSLSGEPSTDPEKPTYTLPSDHHVPQMLANNVSSPQRTHTMPMNSLSENALYNHTYSHCPQIESTIQTTTSGKNNKRRKTGNSQSQTVELLAKVKPQNSTAISIVFLMATIGKPCSQWDSNDVMQILQEGMNLHREATSKLYRSRNIHLLHTDFPETISFRSASYNISYPYDNIIGITKNPQHSTSFQKDIAAGFVKSNTILLSYNTRTIGIVKTDSKYYLINLDKQVQLHSSYMIQPVIHCKNFSTLIGYLEKVCKNKAYLISPLEISVHASSRRQNKGPTNLQALSAISSRSSVVGKFVKDISQVPSEHCYCCKHFLFPSKVHLCDFQNQCTQELHVEKHANLCSSCYTKLSKNIIPNTAYVYNNLDPGEIPTILRDLWTIEKRLIALIQIFLTVVTLPGGQYAEKGNAVHIPVNVSTQTTNLYNPLENNNIITICCEKPSQQPVDVLLRWNTLIDSLTWLNANNPLYSDIEVPARVHNSTPSSNTNNQPTDKDVIVEEYSTIPIDYTQETETSTDVVENPLSKRCLPITQGRPVNLKDTVNGEEKAFPWLFPYGNSGISPQTSRTLTISDLQYYQSRLYNIDPRWRKDITYLMSALNNVEWKQLLQVINVYMRTTKPNKGGNSSSHYQPISAGDLNNLNENPQILNNTYMFTKRIRGTAAYWKDALQNLLAMVKTLGPPTFFLTLSCNDNWPELQNCMKCNSRANDCQVKYDPLMASLAFHERWESLLRNVLKSKNPPLGKIHDYFVRVEFQTRGSPHLHIFLWTDLAVSFESGNGHKIISLIDTTISTCIPSATDEPDLHELVKRFQVHRHSFSCTKGKSSYCRFLLPRPICNHTHLTYNLDSIATQKGRFYETKRCAGDEMVNPYNPIIMKHWRANHDLQLLGNAESCAYYVCKYVCKAEPEELRSTLKSLFDSFKTSSLTKRQQMIKVGVAVLKHRKLGLQELCHRLGGIHLYKTSRTTISLNTMPLNQRYKIVKPKAKRENLPDDCKDFHMLFESNYIDYYHARPYSLESWCLHRFTSWYALCNDKNKASTSRTQPRYNLLAPFQNKVIMLRTKARIIRTYYFRNGTHNYYYSNLLLYKPHRNESDFLKNYDSAEDAFAAEYSSFDKECIASTNFAVQLEKSMQRIRLIRSQLVEFVEPSFNDIHVDGTLKDNPANNLSCIQLDMQENINTTSHMDNTTIGANSCKREDMEWHILSTCNVTESDLEKDIKTLNKDQLKVFEKVRRHFTSTENGPPMPLRFFCTGGAGTGKSFLLKTLVAWMKLCTFQYASTSPVIVTAPTGVAAHNINGFTMHSIFKLPIQHGYEPQFYELSHSLLKTLRKKFNGVHTIIIDEISMISPNTFHFIHQRLCSIANNDQPFGGYNILLFGDFYQLRPVRAHYLFTDNIWPLFTPLFLNINQRQSGNNTFIKTLNNIRLGVCTEDDLSLLTSRLCISNESVCNYLHIFPTLEQVKQHNMRQQSRLCLNFHIITASHAYSTFDMNPGFDVPHDHIPKDDRNAGGLLHTLHISEGTRVMLLRNLLTEEGLVNGAMGTVHKLKFVQDELIEVLVKFDDVDVGHRFHINDENNSVPIQRYTQEFLYKGRYINREQFPLTPCWACTVHKTQGLSLTNAVISIGSKVFQAGQAYVALSRLRSINGLYILELCPQRIYSDSKVLEEYNRLLNLSSNNDGQKH